MRFLLYGIHFAPELVGVGKYSGELTEWLTAQGHEVRVVTAPPYYPSWKVSKPYFSWLYKRDKWNGARVIRCPLWVPKRPTAARRILHLASFALTSLPIALWQAATWRPDVVGVVAPALFCAPGARLAAYLGGAKSWLHFQDFELDVAINLGLVSSRLGEQIFAAPERWLLRRFDLVSTISARMREHVIMKGVTERQAVLFPNWVDTRVIYPLNGSSVMREELGIPDYKIVALYSGNFGEKQGVEILAETAMRLNSEPNLLFVFCGEGATRARLERMVDGLTNVRLLGLQPEKRLNDLLNVADIHILPQREGAEDLVMPSKLSGMLASGKPVVAIARAGTEVAQVVDGRGVVVPPGDSAVIAQAVLDLAENPSERERLGRAARAFAEAHWDRDAVLSGGVAALTTLCDPHPAHRSAG